MASILLVRHAESELHGRFCGSSDPGLSPRGLQEARQLAEKLAGFPMAQIYCSPLRRAQLTVAAWAQAKTANLTTMGALREIGFGEWEGLAWKEIEERDPAFARLWMERFPDETPPGGEAFVTFRQRVEQAWRQICANAAQGPNGRVAIVAHGGVLQVIQACHTQRRFQDVAMLQTAEFVVLELDD
jgi:broad specificity phosphatase PhoE